MKQQGHIQTAIKALQRQIEKYKEQGKKEYEKAKTAQQNYDFFNTQVVNLEKQISSLQENEAVSQHEQLELIT